ncbi:MAG: TRAM domain-containing protein, partial [Gammaproteobacteria bacterium]
LTIRDVSMGGAGVAKQDKGRTVFVPYTMAGDIVKARITELKKKFANAALLDIIEASPDRLTPKCQLFAQCGGCQWQHIPYAKQWQIKLAGIHQALKSSQIKLNVPIEEHPADQIWNYRNRIQLRGYKDTLGYYAPRSHDIVDLNQCEIASPQINAALANVRAEGKQFNKPYKVEVEVLANGEIRTIWNDRHAAAGFRQVNDEQNQQLKRWIKETLVAQQPVFDLFGGSANLSWALTEQNRQVHCIDISTPTRRPEHCPSTLEFYQSDVLPWLKQRITDIKFKRLTESDSPCSAIIDPPRGGLGDTFDDIVERLEILNVNEVVAVGCKTDTWARDIARFIARGWELRKVAAFDFFPHTIHLESTAYLTRD